MPSALWVAASILAKEATTAEAWATAALIAGTTNGMAHLVADDFAAAMTTRDNKLLLTLAMADKLIETNTNLAFGVVR